MLDWKGMERLIALVARADRGLITADEKGELRALMARGTPTAWDFAWDDLLQIAYCWIGVYSFAKMGAEAAAADAS